MLKWIGNLKIGSKLTLILIIIVVFFAVFMASTYWVLNQVRIGSPLYNSIEARYEGTVQISRLESALVEVRIKLLSFMNEKDTYRRGSGTNQIYTLSGEIDSLFDALLSNIKDNDVLIQLKSAHFTWDEFRNTRDKEIIPAVYSGRLDLAEKIAYGIQLSRYERFIEMIRSGKNCLALLNEESKRKSNRTMTTLLAAHGGINVLILGIIIFLTLFISRRIARPVRDLSEVSLEITAGNLSKRINTIKSKDEIGELETHFNRFIESLNRALLEVESVSSDIKSSSDETADLIENSLSNKVRGIKQGITNIGMQSELSLTGFSELTRTVNKIIASIASMAENMERQSSAVEESASSIEEMVRNIDNTATMTSRSSEISKNLNSVAHEGSEEVKNAIQSIKEVSDFSQQILKLLGLISNIAKQTNLLAMNAAIEAAHAGEAGKGFAIVADEIRRLSEDTNKNARDINDVVNTIVSRIEGSVTLAEKAGLGLDMITAYSQQNFQIITQLNVAMAEQNHGAKEVLSATEDLVKITDEVKAAMAEQKQGSNEFGLALSELRDLAQDNKQKVDVHMLEIDQLVTALDRISAIIVRNHQSSGKLRELVGQFVLSRDDKTDLEITAVRLVD